MPAAKRKVLFVASECIPYAKAGGLGDVVGALSKVLVKRGHDVRVLMPLYASVDRARHGVHEVGSMCVHMGYGEENWVGLNETVLDELVPVYMIDYRRFFDRPGIYGYPDDPYRFALLAKSALQFALDTDFVPDVMHLHDWPTALVAAYLNTGTGKVAPLSRSASVLTIHNIMYQGKFETSALGYIGLGFEHFNPDELEDHGGINLLKPGIHFADAITTVSPTHAREMMSPIGGHGLGPLLHRRETDLTGILNGIDDDVWNPETDLLIPERFDAHDMHGKLKCKRTLQQRFDLEPRPDLPLLATVSRFVEQKGFDLVRDALPRALDALPIQFVVLGSGDPAIEQFFRDLAARYPGRVGMYVGYSEELAHLIEAGADLFLMPSLYEPCGLNQMYSMRYGTLPIVRETGGLADTVEDHDPESGSGTGFTFAPPDAGALYETIARAVSTWFRHPAQIAQLRRRGMAKRFLWDASAAAYEAVYERAIAARRATLSPAMDRIVRLARGAA
ncbi:MAG TPA: glycogen synthase GlgA [Candidatus Bathyarchaeia archaeon]|nr:glycogen synthase GlgA [Candidatus Bathyarchaeia archaeon]